MSSDKILHAAMAAFKQTFTDFCQEEGMGASRELTADTFRVMTRGLMAAAQSAGQQGLAAWLEQRDTRRSNVVVNGVTYRYKNTMPKTFLTMFGDVVVERAVYGNDILGGYVVPLDRALGLSKDERATLDSREMILFAVSGSTPDEVATLLSKASLCRPSRTTIHRDRLQRRGTDRAVPGGTWGYGAQRAGRTGSG